MIEYESREFCKDINCNIQKMLDDNNEIIEIKSDLKEKHCKRKCKAYKFHQWLKENNYKIVKDMDNTVEVLRDWFNILEENLADNLSELDIYDMDLEEPLEYIENCIWDLEGRVGERIKGDD